MVSASFTPFRSRSAGKSVAPAATTLPPAAWHPAHVLANKPAGSSLAHAAPAAEAPSVAAATVDTSARFSRPRASGSRARAEEAHDTQRADGRRTPRPPRAPSARRGDDVADESAAVIGARVFKAHAGCT